jgi:hypothetical protein
MTLQGHIKNGAIVLDQPQELPEGAAVQVEVLEPGVKPEPLDGPTLLDRLRPIVGAIDDLPEDASVNLKHYLYGHPKR